MYGYTDVISSKTEMECCYYDSFNLNTFKNVVINPILKNYNLVLDNLLDGINRLSEEYKIEYDSQTNTLKLFKNVVTKGYIYNSYSEVLLYVFFCKKIYSQNNFPVTVITDEIFEEKSLIEHVEYIKPKKVEFIDELKHVIKNRIPPVIIEKEEKQEEFKSDFENELQHMIKFRKDRCKKRERKLAMKKRK